MNAKTTKQELSLLRKRLSLLEAKVRASTSSSWKGAFGALKGDLLHRKAAALGAAWRAKEDKRK